MILFPGCDHLQRRSSCRRSVHRLQEAGEVLEPLDSKTQPFQKQKRIQKSAQLSDCRTLKLFYSCFKNRERFHCIDEFKVIKHHWIKNTNNISRTLNY